MKILSILILFIGLLCSQWYSNWSYRKIITNNYACGGDLTNFPLLVVISNDTDLQSHASNNGHDIVFTLFSSTDKLAHEIEYYDSGTLIAWVKMPYFSASVQTSNILYMYFDKAKPGNQQNTFGVWTESYYMVHHINENSGLLYDSSSSGFNGTLNYTGGASTLAINGLIGRGGYFDGTNDHINLGYVPVPANKSFTLSIWKKSEIPDAEAVSRYSLFSNNFYFKKYQTADPRKYLFYICDGSGVNRGASHFIPAGIEHEWFCYTAVYNHGESKYFIYANNNLIFTGNCTNTSKTSLGSISSSGTDGWIGFLDEARISTNIRSSNWIATEFSNQINPAAYRTPGIIEVFPGVIFSSFTPASVPCLVNESTVFALNARVVTGSIASVNINWGDGSSTAYSPGIPDISAENFSHTYITRSDFTVTAIVTAASGFAATNSTPVFTLPYRFYNPYNINFSLEPNGCLVKWDITSSAHVQHFNLYRGNNLQARIENPALREYLDECVIFGDRYSYWIEAVYSAGSFFSVTNISEPHAVYRREAVLGTGGGNLAAIFADLFVPPNVLTGTCTISMSILSNRHESFYESGKPVYQQIEIAGADIQNQLKGSMVLKFRVPATNGSLCFKPVEASGYFIGDHKENFFCANWNGSTWTRLSTVPYIDRRKNNFSFLQLEITINMPGIYGVMYDPGKPETNEVTIKNRLFAPGLVHSRLSSLQVSFPNPDMEQVIIQVFDLNGHMVYEKSGSGWINFWSWDGKAGNNNLCASGPYIISIRVGGKGAKTYNIHSYLLK